MHSPLCQTPQELSITTCHPADTLQFQTPRVISINLRRQPDILRFQSQADINQFKGLRVFYIPLRRVGEGGRGGDYVVQCIFVVSKIRYSIPLEPRSLSGYSSVSNSTDTQFPLISSGKYFSPSTLINYTRIKQ